MRRDKEGDWVCNGGEMPLPQQAKPAMQCLFELGCAGRDVAGSGNWDGWAWRVGGGRDVLSRAGDLVAMVMTLRLSWNTWA